jgi:3-isopropylmalate dehydrogenase
MNQFMALIRKQPLNIANPLATILSAAMMFEDALDYMKRLLIRAAVNKSLNKALLLKT